MYLNRGSVYEQRQDYKLAVKDYTQALTLVKPGEFYQVLGYFNRARAYTKMEAYDQALEDIRQGEKKLMPYFSKKLFPRKPDLSEAREEAAGEAAHGYWNHV